MHHPDHPVTPRLGCARVHTDVTQDVTEDAADTCTQQVHVIGDRILPGRQAVARTAGPVQQWAAHHEAIQLRFGLDEREVCIDSGLQDGAWLRFVLHRPGDRVGEHARDAAADGQVEVRFVGEVAVNDRLTGAGLRRDLLHADPGAVPAHRGDRRGDQLVATCISVRLPPKPPTVCSFLAGGARSLS